MKLAYDMHIHSCLSPCGEDEMTPNNIVNMAKLKGLDIISVCDHNSVLNLPAIISIAKRKGITVVPAAETETVEEFHTLCYFEKLESAEEFGNIIYKYLKIKNKTEIFGNQYVLNEYDEIVYDEEKLLATALSISIEKLLEIVRSLGGVCVPAHIDKPSYSIISNMGFIPDDLDFYAVEVANKDNIKNYKQYKALINSDAHFLGKISEAENFIELKENSSKEFVNYLKRKY